MENEELSELKKELDEFKDLDALASSEGGKVLIDKLNKSILAILNELLTSYKDLNELQIKTELIRINSQLSLVRILTKSKSNKETLEEQLKTLL